MSLVINNSESPCNYFIAYQLAGLADRRLGVGLPFGQSSTQPLFFKQESTVDLAALSS